MSRALTVLALAGALAAATIPVRAAAATPGGSVLVIALPAPEARLYLDRHLGAVALGVYPPSRSATEFVRHLGDASEDGDLGSTQRRLTAARIQARAFVSPKVEGQPVALVPPAFVSGAPGSADALVGAPLAVAALRYADDADALTKFRPRFVYVIGVGARTPVLIGAPGAGLLQSDRTRRPGVVTPQDVALSILDAVGAPGGERLSSDADPEPFGALDDLAARMERDARFGEGLSQTTAGFGIGLIVFASFFALLRRRRLSAMTTRAAAMVPAGYIGALFLPTGRWQLRAVVLLAAVVLGAIANVRRTRSFCARVLLLTGIAVIALTIAAARNPGGEPALSLWGDPLTSFRFFGLRNHLAAFLGAPLVAALVMVELPVVVVLPGVLVVLVVTGAATLGANFVGVATIGFGATAAMLALAAGRPRARHAVIGVVAGAAAFAAALGADAGARVSHGGRAVDRIREGGLSAGWRLFRERAALNRAEVTSLHAVGWIALVLASLALGAMFVWAFRGSSAPRGVRAAVFGLSAAAMSAIVVEDSGFYTGAIIGLFPAIVLFAWLADRRDPDPAMRAAPLEAPPPSGSASAFAG